MLQALTHLIDKSPAPTIGAGLPELPIVRNPQFDGLPILYPRMMWLGHASCYLQLPAAGGETFGILFDPIFSSR
jgi:hypothetical protein